MGPERLGEQYAQIQKQGLEGAPTMAFPSAPTFNVEAAAQPQTALGKGVARGVSGLTSPANVMQLGAMMGGGAQAGAGMMGYLRDHLLHLYFTGQMGLDTLESVWHAAGRYAAGDTAGAQQLLGEAVPTAVLTALGIGDIARGERPQVEPEGVRTTTGRGAQAGGAGAQRSETTAITPPGGGPVARPQAEGIDPALRAIAAMRGGQALGVEGGPRPVTAPGVTGAREVAGEQPRAAVSAPIEQPKPTVGTVTPKPPEGLEQLSPEQQAGVRALEAQRAARRQPQPTQPFELPKRRPDMTAAFPERRIGEQPRDFDELIKSQVARGQITREEAARILAKRYGQVPEKPTFRWSELSPEQQAILMKEPKRAEAPPVQRPEAPTPPTPAVVPPVQPVREAPAQPPRAAREPVPAAPAVGAPARPSETAAAGASAEALARQAAEQQKGIRIEATDTRSGQVRPLIGLEAHAGDIKPGAYERIERVHPDGRRELMAEGPSARPIAPKTPAAAPMEPVARPAAAPEAARLPSAAEASKTITALTERAKGDPRVTKAMRMVVDKLKGLPEATQNVARRAAFAAMEKSLNEGSNPAVAGGKALDALETFRKQAGFVGPGRKPPSGGAVVKDATEKLTEAVEKLPKGSLEERLKGASAAAGAAKSQGPFAHALTDLASYGKAFADWYKHPEKGQKLSEALTEKKPAEAFKDALGKYLSARQHSMARVDNAIKEVKRVIPDARNREAITNYMQAGGDTATLADRASKSGPKFKEGYERAGKLTDPQKRVAEALKAHFEDRLQQAQKLGIIEHGLENYVNQMWEKDTAFKRGLISQLNAGKLDTNFRFAKERFYDSYFEGEKAGKHPVTKDIAKLVTAYSRSMDEAIAARSFVRELWTGDAADKRPLLVPEWKSAKMLRGKDLGPDVEAYAIPLHGPGKGRLMDANLAEALGIPVNEKTLTETDKVRTETGDYKHIDHPAFRKYVFSMEGPEGPVFVQSDALAHPDIATHLKNLYTKSWFREFAPTRWWLQSQGVMKQILLGFPGFHYVQEGLHSGFHKVNPFHPDLLTGKRLKEALSDSTVDELMRGGLMLYDHEASSKFGEGISGMADILRKIPGVEKLEANNRVAAFALGMQDHLFGTYIPGLKATMAKAAFGRNLKEYAKDLASGKVTRKQLAEMTASQANAAFGELNYDWMGRNKTAQDLFRMVALAPDFLEARARFAGQALRPYGKEQMAALFLRAGLYQWVAIRGLNMMLNNGNAYADDPNMLFKVKVGGKSIGMRTIAGDIMHLVKDPFGFMVYRSSPGMRLIMEGAAGYFKGKQMTVADAMKTFIPIPAQGWAQDLIQKNVRDKKYADSLMEAFGVQASKYYTPAQRQAIEQKEEKRQLKLHGEKAPAGPRIKGLAAPARVRSQ